MKMYKKLILINLLLLNQAIHAMEERDNLPQSGQASLLRNSHLEQSNPEDTVSQVRLIESYFKQGNLAEAAKLCEPLAKNNNVAQYYLALIKESQGEIEQAKELLTLASDKGDYIARDKLGVIYATEKNYSMAEECFKLSAPYLAQSKHNLGYIYKERGMVEEAITWFKKAAEENNAHSQNELALLLLSERNDKDGYLKYVKLAADQGLPGAQINYGSTLLEQGNFKEGYSYINLAALQNHPVAVMIMQIRTNLRSQFGLK